MKSIIKSLLIVVAVAAVAGGATWAYFTDNVTVANNTFSSGTLDLIYSGTASTTMTLPHMEPGVWYGDQAYPGGDYQLTVFNHTTLSTIAAKYRFRQAVVSQDLDIYDWINTRVYRYEGTGSWTKYYDGKLNAMTIDPSLVSAMSNLPVGNSHLWKFAFQLDSSVGNAYQNKTATWNLYLDATQASNLGW